MGLLGVMGALPVGASPAAAVAVAGGAVPFSLAALGWFFLKVGSVLFGSGYVLLVFLETDLVDRWGWLTRQQLLDAVAIGQVTPGPLLTTATFIGQLLGGFAGALIATAAIFLPAFVLVALSGPLIPRLRRSPVAGVFLDGVIAASMALMAVVTFALGRTALVSVPAVLTGLAAAVALFWFRVNATWLVGLGAAGGWLWSLR